VQAKSRRQKAKEPRNQSELLVKMYELWPVMAKYSRIGVLMVYLCEFRSKTDNEVRHGFLGNPVHAEWCI
jgi:hypothetical protein